jgi:hypothetical protein
MIDNWRCHARMIGKALMVRPSQPVTEQPRTAAAETPRMRLE